MCILLYFFSETARIHVTVAAVEFAVCIIYSVYFVSHTDYTNIRKTYACSVWRSARVFRETINQRRSVSEGAAAVSVRCDRDRGTYTSAPIHRTKQNKNDRFPFHFIHTHTHIYVCIIRSRAGRPIKPMQTCLHRIFKEGFIYIIFPKWDIHKTLHIPCMCVCFNVNVCLLYSPIDIRFCSKRIDAVKRVRRRSRSEVLLYNIIIYIVLVTLMCSYIPTHSIL